MTSTTKQIHHRNTLLRVRNRRRILENRKPLMKVKFNKIPDLICYESFDDIISSIEKKKIILPGYLFFFNMNLGFYYK